MLRFAICEDEINVFTELKEYIERYCVSKNFDCKVFYYADADELLSAKQNYDILFLDIMLGNGIDGIEAGKQLREMENTAYFIMVTSREDLALKGYAANVFRYLVKPVSQNEIDKTLDDLIKTMEHDKNTIKVTFGRKSIYVKVRDILYVESHARSRYIVTISGKSQTTIKSDALIEQLSNFSCFFSPRKSHLVNMEHVRSMSAAGIVMRNGEAIKFARGKHQDFMVKFSEFLKAKG